MENRDLGSLEFPIQVIGLLFFSAEHKWATKARKCSSWRNFADICTCLMSKEGLNHSYDKKSRKTFPVEKES